MEKELTKPKKLAYVAPAIELMVIEMEQGIAAGSATVLSEDSSSKILDEWDTGTDRETETAW